MNVQPATMDQVRRSWDGGMVIIDRDVGSVAEELRRIDPGLQVRFGERGNPPFYAVLYRHCPAHRDFDPACQDCRDGRTRDLVLTVQAHRNALGVWEGLDQRVVDRVRRIDPRGTGGYDFAVEVERQNRQAEEAKRQRGRERIEEHGDLLAHAIRKDLGARYRGRAVINNKRED